MHVSDDETLDVADFAIQTRHAAAAVVPQIWTLREVERQHLQSSFSALRWGHRGEARSGRIVRATTEHRAIPDAQARYCNTAEEVTYDDNPRKGALWLKKKQEHRSAKQ